MKRQHLDFEVWEKEALKNPQLKEEYDRLEPEFAIIEAIINARAKKGITQEKLAEKMGTTQSVIARLESGKANPTVKVLQKIAKATDSKLVIQFQ